MKRLTKKHPDIIERLASAGLRPTRQRIQLASLLLPQPWRHVTAEELHKEAAKKGVTVSLATVYNTLHQFTEAGLLRHITLDGGRSYFDNNTDSHHHFLNEDTGELLDIPAKGIRISGLPAAPDGTSVKSVDVVVRVKSSWPELRKQL